MSVCGYQVYRGGGPVRSKVRQKDSLLGVQDPFEPASPSASSRRLGDEHGDGISHVHYILVLIVYIIIKSRLLTL